MALTGKKQKFAEAKGKGMSNKDAAIAAGYSAASAGAAGSRLAKDPDVLAQLERKAKAKLPKKSAPAAKAAPAKPLEVPRERALDDEAETIWEQATQFSDPKAFLKAAMNDNLTEPKLRVFAANALMPYFHKKLGDTGKKEQAAVDAKKAAGRFAPAAPPRLAAAGGKKV